MTEKTTRRGFVRTVAAAAASTALSRRSVLGAGERVRVGFIGVGNRGDQVLDAFLQQPDVEIAAVCDLYRPYVDFAVARCGGSRPKGVSDYRRLLDMNDLDAVAISTPDHWHALQTIHACQAGEDQGLSRVGPDGGALHEQPRSQHEAAVRVPAAAAIPRPGVASDQGREIGASPA
jgi:hypothetical protein